MLADGGFSDFQILKGVWLGRAFFSFHMGDAISVCPFYFSRADITPSEYVPFWWAFYPPPTDKLRRVYHLGYRDALTWLQLHGQIPYGGSPPPPPPVRCSRNAYVCIGTCMQ